MELHLAGYIVRRGGPAVVSHDYFGDVTIFQISIAKTNKFGLLGIKLLVIHVRWFTDSQGRWECSIRDGVPPPAGPGTSSSPDWLFWGLPASRGLFIIDLKAKRVPLYSPAQPERVERLQPAEERHPGG